MSDNLTRRASSLALVTSALVWLASALVNPGERADTAAQLDIIRAHPTRWSVAAALLVLGTVLLVGGLAAIARVAGPRSPLLTLASVTAVGYGTVVSIGDCFGQFVLGAAAHQDQHSALALVDRMEGEAAAGLFFATGGLAFTLGFVALGVAVARSRAVPAWAGVVMALSAVANIVGWSIAANWLIAASCVPLLVSFAAVARADTRAGALTPGRAAVGVGS